VQSAAQQLQAIGNTTAPNGTYLFGGSRGSVAPFQTSGSGNVVYMGDGGQSQAAISTGTTASTIANGDAFVSSLSGDGIGEVTAAAGNTGSGQLIAQGTVSASAAAAFQSGTAPITVSVSNSGGAIIYTATQGGTTLATGPATANATLQLAGVNYELTGAPAAGDSFTITPSRPQSAFTLLQSISKVLSTAGSTPAQVAQTHQVLNQSLAGLSQYQQAVVTAQAQNGVTLQAITNAGTGNTNQATQIQTSVQNATSVNMPVAIANLDATLTAVQAAMKTFGNVQNLSLFNYL
jgi:flagellar hook-associated protein 3 FlgL